MSATVLFSVLSVLLAAPAAPNSSLAGLPGVNLKGLEKQEVEALNGLLGDGACPCNPKVTLKQCIADKTCADATLLANFGADKFREGLGVEEVSEKVIANTLRILFATSSTWSRVLERGHQQQKLCWWSLQTLNAPTAQKWDHRKQSFEKVSQRLRSNSFLFPTTAFQKLQL